MYSFIAVQMSIDIVQSKSGSGALINSSSFTEIKTLSRNAPKTISLIKWNKLSEENEEIP